MTRRDPRTACCPVCGCEIEWDDEDEHINCPECDADLRIHGRELYQVDDEDEEKKEETMSNVTSFKRNVWNYFQHLRDRFNPPPLSEDAFRFQKVRLEVCGSTGVLFSSAQHNDEGNSIISNNCFDFKGISKEDAARGVVDVLDRGNFLDLKTFDDIQIVDADSPDNSGSLRIVALKNLSIANVRPDFNKPEGQ